MDGCHINHESTLCQEVKWVELTPSPRVWALRHGFNTTPRHAYTASEFTPVTRIYSGPSWDQYLTVGMPRIRRGLTSTLYPGWFEWAKIETEVAKKSERDEGIMKKNLEANFAACAYASTRFGRHIQVGKQSLCVRT
ncbi:hypothetical protein PIB30_056764 [Stylosanthes scabra]|uniref:Uncharacterized protein n=1 Tax=Stylosanthes scabra TaxID=79078 RepID=A0ABU6UI80_9FABA|nr:hypothetical protein [Stylosanthes scabra]